MKKNQVLWLTVKELKTNALLLALSFILLTAMASTAFFISSASSTMMEVFYNYANTMSPDEDGFLIALNGLHYASSDIIKELPFQQVFPQFNGSIDPEDFSIEGKTIRNGFIFAEFVTEDAHEVVAGLPFSQEDNFSTFAWISEKVADDFQLSVGDHLIYRANTVQEKEYEVAGIYDTHVLNYDIMIPFGTYYQSELSVGNYVEHEVFGILADSRDYSSVCTKLQAKKVTPSSPLDDSFRSLTLIHVLLQVIFISILLAGVWSFSSIYEVIIERRFRFIMRMRVLGMKSSHLAGVYAGLIISVTMLSFSVSIFLNHVFTDDTQKLAIEMFPGVEATHIQTHVPITGGIVLSAAILSGSIYMLFRRMNSKDMIGMLEERKGNG